MLLNEDKIEPSKCYISARVLCLLTHLRQPVGEPRNAGQYKSHADRSIHQGPFRIASPPYVTASAPVPITKRLPFLFSHNFIILRLNEDYRQRVVSVSTDYLGLDWFISLLL